MTINNKLRGFREIWQFDNRWYLIFSRIFFPGQSVQLYRLNGVEFLNDQQAGDANGAREVITTPMYRRYFSQMDLSGEINVLDLGSNNGGFPLLLKAAGHEIKTLACVELNPKTFSRLCFNLELNFRSNFTALNYGVCGDNREISIRLGDGSTGDNIYCSNGGATETALRISGRTFDDVFDEVYRDQIVDLCKIDIEGAEFEVFEGNHANRIAQCKYLLMEIHHAADRPRNRVLARLFAAGFEEIGGEANIDEKHHVHLFINKTLR